MFACSLQGFLLFSMQFTSFHCAIWHFSLFQPELPDFFTLFCLWPFLCYFLFIPFWICVLVPFTFIYPSLWILLTPFPVFSSQMQWRTCVCMWKLSDLEEQDSLRDFVCVCVCAAGLFLFPFLWFFYSVVSSSFLAFDTHTGLANYLSFCAAVMRMFKNQDIQNRQLPLDQGILNLS